MTSLETDITCMKLYERIRIRVIVAFAVPLLILLLLTSAVSVGRFRGSMEPAGSFVLSDRSSHFSDRQCAECHAEITESFREAPHSRTLHRASDIDGFAGQRFQCEQTGVEYAYDVDQGQLFLSSSAFSRRLPIDWIFGSGTHARTPLITWTDSDGNTTALEHRVSWYPDGTLGTTLGMEELHESVGIQALGLPRTPSETINCFGCHAAHVAVKDHQIQFDAVQPGISCSRCHWNTEQHAHEMEHGKTSTIEQFSKLSPLESVHRCGECHRRADELGGPIDPSDKVLPRFASVGLVQSKCFIQQHEVMLEPGVSARLDCTSCHDPHRPARTEWQFHAAVCLNCHDQSRGRATDCTAAGRSDNCLSCHMPSVPAGKHLNFTDHWIRVRDQTTP